VLENRDRKWKGEKRSIRKEMWERRRGEEGSV
jgi:hypothetical protein